MPSQTAYSLPIMRALLIRTSHARGARSLPSNPCSCGGSSDGGRIREGLSPELCPPQPRARLLSSAAAPSVRKRMMPLIKLVHPDMFAQHPPDVASTNSKSLRDLNTLIDAAEALEAAAAAGGANRANGSSGAKSAPAPPTVDTFYNLTFFLHPLQENASSSSSNGSSESAVDAAWQRSGDPINDHNGVGAGDHALVQIRAELRFPPTLSSDPSGSLRGQLRRQLDGLLRRVSATAGEGAAHDGAREWQTMAMEEGVRVREGETMKDFYGGGRQQRRPSGTPPRDGIRTERASQRTNRGDGDDGDDQPLKTSEELRRMTIEHAGDNHHVNPWDAGSGAGLFGGGFGTWFGGGQGGMFGGAEATAQARSRLVDDLLRSGRVQFAGVPISREASALLRLHQTLVKYFEHLELHDRGLWSTVVLVLRAKSDSYEVQVHTGGPVLVFPEKFSERNLVSFLSEVLLSYS